MGAALGITLVLFIVLGGIIGTIIKFTVEHHDVEANIENRVNVNEWDLAMDESHLDADQYHL